MAIRPDFARVVPAARPPFVGRWRELESFEAALWRRLAADEHRVLVFHGVGGVGKTRLLERLRERLNEPDAAGLPRAAIDFELKAHRDPVSGLVHLRNEWRRAGVATFAFNSAFARHFAQSAPGRDIRSDYPELFALENELLAELVGLAGEVFRSVPGLDLMTRAATRLGGNALDWVRGRGHPLIAAIEGMAPQELMVELPMFLGHDVAGHAERQPGTPPVCFVDTYEAAWRDFGTTYGSGASVPDRWLRKLVTNQPGTLFVIFGRRRLDWDRIDPDWGDVTEQIPLDALDASDQETLLDRHGIPSGPVRARMAATAQGHPLMLMTQVRLHQRLAAGGRTPTPDDFPISHKEVLDRFFSHLDMGTRAIMRALAFPAVIDDALWAHLAASGFSAFDAQAPRDVLGDVFFREVEEGRFVMHEVVRDHLVAGIDRDDAAFARRARMAAFRYFDLASGAGAADRGEVPDRSGSSAPRDAALLAAAELLAAADPGSFADWCLGRFRGDLAERGSRHRSLLLEQAAGFASGDPRQQLALAALAIATNPFDATAVDRLVAALGGGAADRGEEDEALLATTVGHLTRGSRRLDPRLDGLLRIGPDRFPNAALRIALSGRDPAEIRIAARRAAADVQAGASGRSVYMQDIFIAAALAGDIDIIRSARTGASGMEQPGSGYSLEDLRTFDACWSAFHCIRVRREAWAIPLVCEELGLSGEAELFAFATDAQQELRQILAALLGVVLRAVQRPAESESLFGFVEGTTSAAATRDQLGMPRRSAPNGKPPGPTPATDGSPIAHGIVRRCREGFLAYTGQDPERYAYMKIDMVIDVDEDPYIFHNNPMLRIDSSVFVSESRKIYYETIGELMTFGARVPPRLAQHILQGKGGIGVCMDEQTGKALWGQHFPIYTVPEDQLDAALKQQQDAWHSLEQALEASARSQACG